jgi:hypothetical protein
VEADTEHLPAARNYQFVNAHGSPLKIALLGVIGTQNRAL